MMTTHSIGILCEGYEEFDYLTCLKELRIFSNKYRIDLYNVKSLTSLYPRYTDMYNQNKYHLIIIFCDTERYSQEYQQLKLKIDNFHNNTVSDKIIFYGSPNTMQIILSHFAQVKLEKANKAKNQNLIKELTNIPHYKASATQRTELMKKINRDNYQVMKNNLKNISNQDYEIPSTNFLELLNNLENDDTSWIDTIQKLL